MPNDIVPFDRLDELDFSDSEYLEDIEKMPKIEQHVHVDGVHDSRYIFSRWEKKGVELKYPNLNQDRSPCKKTGKLIENPQELEAFWHDWDTYSIVDKFWTITGLMQTRDEIRDIFYQYVLLAQKENILYSEPGYALQYSTREGLSMEKVAKYALEGLKKGCKETGCIAPLKIIIGREIFFDNRGKYNPNAADEIVDVAIGYQDAGVAAIDLACWEVPYPPEIAVKAFERTFDTKLKRDVHAGEMSKEENLRNIFTAIHMLKADGLGHAIPLYKGNYGIVHNLLETVKKEKIRVQLNPISNLALKNIDGIDELHLGYLLKNGILATVSADDRGMWKHGSLSKNLYQAGKRWGDKSVHDVTTNGILTAFGLKKENKIKMLKDFERQGLNVDEKIVNQYFEDKVW